MKKIVYVLMLLLGTSLLSISCQKDGGNVNNNKTAIIGKWRRTLSEEYKNGKILCRETYGTDSYKYEWYKDGKLDYSSTDEPINNYLLFSEDGTITIISDSRTRTATYEVDGITLIMAGDKYEIKKLTKKEFVYYERESDGYEWWEYFERAE